MIDTLLGTLLGGAFRMAPEILKWMDRKNERAHEALMFDKQLKSDEIRSKSEIDKINAQSSASMGLADIQAVIEATKAQSTLTGVKLVDAFNSLMRPIITFWWVIVLYSAALIAQFCVSLDSGASTIQSVLAIWGADEKAIVASIISFWFVDRSLRKK